MSTYIQEFKFTRTYQLKNANVSTSDCYTRSIIIQLSFFYSNGLLPRHNEYCKTSFRITVSFRIHEANFSQHLSNIRFHRSNILSPQCFRYDLNHQIVGLLYEFHQVFSSSSPAFYKHWAV